MNNVTMANMNAMAGQVAGGMPMAMNNGVMPAAQQMPQPQTPSHRTMLNTYIYDYFVKEGLFDLARAMLNSEQQINVLQKDSPGRRENGAGDDPMDTDSKDEMDKRPADLPPANIPIMSDSAFLVEWFGLFWDMLNGNRSKPVGNNQVSTYIQHTQQQNRLKQSQQQEMLRQMRPDQMPFNPAMMRNIPNGMPMANKNNLARTAMANNQNNPQAMAIMQQQAKQNAMQRDPSDMDGNRRPASPGSTDNAPSPSKRPRLEGQAPFNQAQPGMMNGRPQQPGMPGQQQFQNFANQPPGAQKNSIATYSQNLQQHHGQQMPNKGMPNPGPQGQGSPMMQPNPAEISNLYNANEFPNGIRPGGPGTGQGGGSNHALQDYQMQLMLLEQQNKKRLMMARQEQDSMGSMPRGDGPAGPGGPGGPPGPNGQAFPDTSPQGARAGASPNPSEQMKRGTPQMNPAGIPSPLPEGAQSRGSPNPMNFMQGGNMDPSMAGNQAAFFKNMNGMDPNMVNPAGHMAGGMRPPPSSHPNQPFNGQVNPQMMAARQVQGGQAGPNQMQWQGGPNGAMIQGPQGPVQGTPQQRAAQMPPPSAPGPGGNPANGRTQPSSPATSNAAPPTPQQSTKANPKKKDTKNTKKGAAAKKSNANTGATPAAESAQDQETPTPATPITPANPAANFAKNGQNAAAQPAPNVQTSAPPAPAPVAPQTHPDPNAFNMDNNGPMSFEISNLDFANPIDSGNVLQDFDFDSFLHDGDAGADSFDFSSNFDMAGSEITTE